MDGTISLSWTTSTPTSEVPPPSELPSIIITRAGLPEEDEQKPLVLINPPGKREPFIYLPPVISISPPSGLSSFKKASEPIFVFNSKPVTEPGVFEPAIEVPKASEDMFVINMDNIITLSESMDDEMILMHQNFARETGNISKSKMNRKMGYLSNVKEAKKILEKIYNKEDTKGTNNKS